MEENDLILLNNSKKHVVRAGKSMNVFSILAAISVLGLVAGGIVMLLISGYLAEDTPYYLDNLLGFGGIAMVVLAAALLPVIVYMRHVVHAANEARINNDMLPTVEYLRQTNSMWHYLKLLFVVVFILSILATVAAVVVFWPSLRLVFGI